MHRLHAFHQSLIGHLLFGIIELAVAYGLISLAIDTGSLLYYFLTLIFLFGALQNFFKATRKAVAHGHKPAKTRCR
jgi:hypothetical protein